MLIRRFLLRIYTSSIKQIDGRCFTPSFIFITKGYYDFYYIIQSPHFLSGLFFYMFNTFSHSSLLMLLISWKRRSFTSPISYVVFFEGTKYFIWDHITSLELSLQWCGSNRITFFISDFAISSVTKTANFSLNSFTFSNNWGFRKCSLETVRLDVSHTWIASLVQDVLQTFSCHVNSEEYCQELPPHFYPKEEEFHKIAFQNFFVHFFVTIFAFFRLRDSKTLPLTSLV